MSNLEQDKKVFRQRLNEVSPSFCLAKWLQVTMHLHSGHNHSCHHPGTHQTPLEELKENPSALHNTCFKKKQRAMMLEGQRPPECQYCWNIEDLGGDHLSDRTLKSSEFWAASHLESISKMPSDQNINPSYVEVSFSNVCNFKCSYCSGNFSSRWKDELNRFGSYPKDSGAQTMEILAEESNPYIQAFWDWWPDLVQDLKVFRITGGEPLLSKNTFRVLEDLSQNPKPQLELAINSNLGISDASFEKFLILAKDLVANKKVKLLRLYTSVDAWDEKAEYIRHGLEFSRFQRNVERFLSEVPGAQLIIMATFNALSLTSFRRLLEYVKEIKVRFTLPRSFCPVYIDISYLRHPLYQTVQILPSSYQKYMDEIVQYVKENKSSDQNPGGFYFFETAKAERISEWMRQALPAEELSERRQDFFQFFKEHDRRRGTSFLKAFPEMVEFWESLQQPITIGVVARNAQLTIAETLENIRLRSGSEVQEILVVDNNSADETVQVVRSWAKENPDVPVRVLERETNHMAEARNQILDGAETKWVYFVDEDCHLQPESWENLIQHMNDTPEAVALGGGNIPVASSQFLAAGFQELQSNPMAHMGSIQARPPRRKEAVPILSSCNLLVKRREALRVGGFDNQFARVGEDLSLCHRLNQAKGQIVAIPEVDVLHRQNLSVRSWCEKMFRYGQAQVEIASFYPQHFRSLRGVQVALLCGLVLSTVAWPMTLPMAFIIYVVALWMSSPQRFSFPVKGLSFVVLSHGAYAMGELFAIFTFGWLKAWMRPQRIPEREIK